MRIILTVILICITAAGVARGQAGPPYEITQSVIAGGGATSTDGGQYSITGTIAQPAAGVQSSNASLGVRGGFWQSFLTPTAATVSISGQVVTFEGRAIRNVRVMLTGGGGTMGTTITSSFGYFRFDEVEAGNTYIVSATHKQFEFAPQVVTVNDEVTDLVITSVTIE